MRRRFGRRRRSGGAEEGGGARGAALDARWLERVVEAGVVPTRALTPLEGDEIPPTLAIVGQGETEAGEKLIVGFALRSGGDALLGTLAAAGRLAAEEGFSGPAIAVAPYWSIASRRRFGLVGATPFRVRAVAAPSLAETPTAVEPEPMDELAALPVARVVAHGARPDDRALCARAVESLAGLAAKHGGAVRGVGRSVELVLLARRVAAVRADDDGVLLDTILPQRSSERLRADGLADAFDRLEGLLRKRLGDRSVREGEDGLRSRLVPAVARTVGLRALHGWPLGGGDADVVDLAGLAPDGRAVVGAIRQRVTLGGLGPILDGLVTLRPALPSLFEGAEAPVRLEAPRLLLAAEQFDPAVLRVLSQLAIETVRLDAAVGGREPELRIGTGTPAARAARPAREPRPEREGGDLRGERPAEPRPERGAEGRRERGERFDRGERGEGGAREARPERTAEERPRERDRDRDRDRDREREPEREAERRAPEPERRPAEAAAAGARPRFEEVSLFDLGEETEPETGGEGDRGGRRRRRRRGRGRRGRGPSGSDGDGEGEGDRSNPEDRALLAEFGVGEDDLGTAPAAVPAHGEGRRRGAAPPREHRVTNATDDEVELADTLAPLAPEPDFVEEAAVPAYDDEEEGGEEADPERERMVRERELRRRARLAKTSPEVEAPPAPRPPKPRRVAILAHADRDSIASAVLLAREQRMLEGIWVYPQSELMTFFRSVATDLREETPIYVIGFAASPARETLQASRLYAGRLAWFDHHVWPPEDLEALRETIGRDAVHVAPGARSTLPLVLTECTRRSRFSDKLVELLSGRFTQHDFERWGRVWWWRLGEIAARPGERRAELEPLLVGRPSDLTRDAAHVQSPPPAEAEFVSARDFRVVHFGGYSLVVVPVPAGVDLPMTARIARERYGAALSLGFVEGDETFVLSTDEGSGRRSLDLLGMVEHLAGKHDWIEALPDADHVARFRAHGVTAHPERLGEIVAEIGMGRSVLEG